MWEISSLLDVWSINIHWFWSILILILVVVFFILLFLILSWKVKFVDLKTWSWYWIKLVTWSFGAWKTKNVYQSAYMWKKANPHWIVISNIDYDFVDIHFDNREDFNYLMDYLVRYIRDTNDIAELKKNFNFPPIKVIVDEAHLYLFSRSFKNFTDDSLLVLTQCRKRNIEIEFITQELWQIDVVIRRLTQYIQYYKLHSFGFRSQVMLYCNDPSNVNINDPEAFEVLEKVYLLPDNIVWFFIKKLKGFYEQIYLTKYVIWWQSMFEKEYTWFKDKLYKKLIDFRKPPEPKEKPALFKLLDKNDTLQDELLKKQSEMIRKASDVLSQEQFEEIFWSIEKKDK